MMELWEITNVAYANIKWEAVPAVAVIIMANQILQDSTLYFLTV